MTLEEILGEVEHLSPGGGLVEITGGEPMLQEREVVPLMQHLLDAWLFCSDRNQRRTSPRASA